MVRFLAVERDYSFLHIYTAFCSLV